MVRRFAIGLIASLPLVATGLLFGAPSAQAGEAWASTSLGSIKVSVLDHTFIPAECTEVPVVAVVTTYGARTSWNISLKATRVGSDQTSPSFIYGEGTSAKLDDFLICPDMGAGVWLVTGEVRMSTFGPYSTASAAISTSFTLNKAPTETIISRLKRSKTSVALTGRVTSDSAQTGLVGIDGTVVIEAQTRRDAPWVRVATANSWSSWNTGQFRVTISRGVPPGSRIRAVFAGDDSTQASMSSALRT